MLIPYPTLLRIGFALGWRYYLVLVVVCAVLFLPLGAVAFVSPPLLDAMAERGIDRFLMLLGVLPAFRLLVCYPIATRWMLRGAALRLGVSAEYSGGNRALQQDAHRRIYLFSWAVFWMLLLWELANAALLIAILPGAWSTWRALLAIAAVHANVAAVGFLAILPLNVSWALSHSFLGAQWALNESPESTS